MEPGPSTVKIMPLNAWDYFLVWSDGRVDAYQRPHDPGQCDIEIFYTLQGPVEHPFPVVDAIHSINSVSAVMQTFEDGRIDMLYLSERCTLQGIGTPSLCTADIDRNGEIGTADLLELLNQWGPCQ